MALGLASESLDELKAGGRAAQRKNALEREKASRAAGSDERGMNINTKISAGLIAQNEDSAKQQDRNLKVVSLSKQIDTMR